MTALLSVLSDLTLLAAALGAGVYCLVLSRRLTRLNSVDKGLGGAIAVLSAQVDDLTRVLAEARGGSEATAERLNRLTLEAQALADDIEEMLAASHDRAGAIQAGQEPEFGSRRGRADGSGPQETPMFRRRATVQEAAE